MNGQTELLKTARDLIMMALEADHSRANPMFVDQATRWLKAYWRSEPCAKFCATCGNFDQDSVGFGTCAVTTDVCKPSDTCEAWRPRRTIPGVNS